MKSFLKPLSVTFISSLLFVGTAFAADEKYTEVVVSNGGTLSGKVSFKGAQPPPEKFEFAKFPALSYTRTLT